MRVRYASGFWKAPPVVPILALMLATGASAGWSSGAAAQVSTTGAPSAVGAFSTVNAADRVRRGTAILTAGKSVSYQDVLRDPDNVALNIAYAKTQIRNGDLLGASATLERVLILAPDNLGARIMYGVVLFRQGNNTAAERELKLVMRFKLPARLRSELQIYVDDLDRRKRQTRGWIMTHAGVQFDTNRSAGPDSGTAETAGGIVRLGRRGRAQSDWAFATAGRAYVEHDLRMARRHRLFGAASWYRLDQARLHQFSFQAVELSAGGVIDFGTWSLRPEIFLRHVSLSHELLSQSIGGRLTGHYQFDGATDAFVWGSIEGSRYNNIHESPTLRLRSGMDWRLGLRLRHRYRPTQRISAALEVNRMAAVADFYSFNGLHLKLDHEWRLPRGQYLLSHLGYTFRGYSGRNPLDGAGGDRRDHQFRARVLYGVPILALHAGLPRFFDRTALTASVEATVNRSNVRNYDTTNWKFAVGITKRFDF